MKREVKLHNAFNFCCIQVAEHMGDCMRVRAGSNVNKSSDTRHGISVISVMSVNVFEECSLLLKLYHNVTSRVLQFVRNAMLQGQIECEIDWNGYLWPCSKNSWWPHPTHIMLPGIISVNINLQINKSRGSSTCCRCMDQNPNSTYNHLRASQST